MTRERAGSRTPATCQLVVLSRQSFPVVYSHNPTTACQDGDFLGPRHHRGQPEPGEAHGRFRPARPATATCSSIGHFYVSLALPARHTCPPPPPPPSARRCPTATRQGQAATTFPGPSAQSQDLCADQVRCPARRPHMPIVGRQQRDHRHGFNSCFAAEAAWAGQGLVRLHHPPASARR